MKYKSKGNSGGGKKSVRPMGLSPKVSNKATTPYKYGHGPNGYSGAPYGAHKTHKKKAH